MKKIVCLFGVNGVGKSSVLDTLRVLDPDTVILHGSSILKKSLGIASYHELESKDATEKKQAYLRGLKRVIGAIEQGTIIVDTHLVVTMRRPQGRCLEDMWDESLRDIFGGFAYMTASPQMVSERRRKDLVNNLRIRQSDERSCLADLADNDSRWDTVSGHCRNSCVIVNDTALEFAVEKLRDFIGKIPRE